MMELFGRVTRIDFVRRRRIAYLASAVLIAASLLAFAVRGLNLSQDLSGGSLIEVAYSAPVDLPALRQSLSEAGFEHATVQHFGSARDVLVRVPLESGADQSSTGQRVLKALAAGQREPPDLRRLDYVGPQVGDELVEDGGLAMLLALGGILVYIWLRFERTLAVGAIAATIHDPLAILGFFALTGMEFDLTVVAAILAIIGYSVNDTIVVFDRIRDNLRRLRRASVEDVINESVNQTLSRTILTSGTTLLVVIALLVFGGPLLRSFSVALALGILVGTYSSIYIASSFALDLGLNRAGMLPVEPEADGRDLRP